MGFFCCRRLVGSLSYVTQRSRETKCWRINLIHLAKLGTMVHIDQGTSWSHCNDTGAELSVLDLQREVGHGLRLAKVKLRVDGGGGACSIAPPRAGKPIVRPQWLWWWSVYGRRCVKCRRTIEANVNFFVLIVSRQFMFLALPDRFRGLHDSLLFNLMVPVRFSSAL